jgi:hypothetical protein
LSEAKNASKPHPLAHLSTIRIGSTTFTAHIHPDWPCDACQLSGNELRLDEGTDTIVATPERPVGVVVINKEEQRKREMAALKEAYVHERREPSRVYQDRAAIRRRMNPDRPDRPHVVEREEREKRSASPEPKVKTSIAVGMLAAQGWVPGQGLGKNGEGRATPIQPEMRIQRAGLGTLSGEDRRRSQARRYEESR